MDKEAILAFLEHVHMKLRKVHGPDWKHMIAGDTLYFGRAVVWVEGNTVCLGHTWTEEHERHIPLADPNVVEAIVELIPKFWDEEGGRRFKHFPHKSTL